MDRNRGAILALAVAVLAACYAPILRGMASQWASDEDMGHGFIVPVVVIWIIWKERTRWLALPRKTSAGVVVAGFSVLGAGAALHAASVLGGGLFAGSLAFLLSLAGIVILVGGFDLLRAWAFPLVVSLFMLPKLAIVYNQVTLPLQLLASRMAAEIVSITSTTVIREGNILDAGGHRFEVAEACSGIRYLLPLGFMGVVLGYAADPKPWMRGMLLAAAVPLALLANAIRVAVVVRVAALDTGALHALLGWLIFLMCLGALALVRLLGNTIYRRYES